MKKKGSKKKNIAIYAVIGLVLIFGVLFFLNNGKKELVLSCMKKEETNQFFSSSRSVEVYKKGKKTLYYDNLEIIPVTKDEKINTAIETFLNVQAADIRDYGIINLEKSDNKYILKLEAVLNNFSKEELINILDTDDISVSGLKLELEKDGLTCEEY